MWEKKLVQLIVDFHAPKCGMTLSVIIGLKGIAIAIQGHLILNLSCSSMTSLAISEALRSASALANFGREDSQKGSR